MTDSQSDGSTTDLSSYVTADENSGGSEVRAERTGRDDDVVDDDEENSNSYTVCACAADDCDGGGSTARVTSSTDRDRTPLVDAFSDDSGEPPLNCGPDVLTVVDGNAAAAAATTSGNSDRKLYVAEVTVSETSEFIVGALVSGDERPNGAGENDRQSVSVTPTPEAIEPEPETATFGDDDVDALSASETLSAHCQPSRFVSTDITPTVVDRRPPPVRRKSLEDVSASSKSSADRSSGVRNDAPVPKPRRRRNARHLLARKHSDGQILVPGGLQLTSGEPGTACTPPEAADLTPDLASGTDWASCDVDGAPCVVTPTIRDVQPSIERLCSLPEVDGDRITASGSSSVLCTNLDEPTWPVDEATGQEIVWIRACDLVSENEAHATQQPVAVEEPKTAPVDVGGRRRPHLNVESLRRSLGKISSLGKEHGRDKDRTDRSKDDTAQVSPSIKADTSDEQLIQRSVIVQRDERGYGFTVSGDNPVFVQSVKENGAAMRAGVQCGDRIIKVNGTLVTSSNHMEVVKMIKSGTYVSLTLLGRPSSGVAVCTPKHLEVAESSPTCPASGPLTGNPVLDRERISGPQAVGVAKDLEYKAQKVATIQMMHKQVLEEYEKMKQEYAKNPTEQIQLRLEVKQQMLRRVESQLRSVQLESQRSVRLSEDSDSSESRVAPHNQTTSVSTGGHRHRRTESMPEPMHKIEEASARDRMSSSFADGTHQQLEEEREVDMLDVSDEVGNSERKMSAPNIASTPAWPDLPVETVHSQPDVCTGSYLLDDSQTSRDLTSSGQQSVPSTMPVKPQYPSTLPLHDAPSTHGLPPSAGTGQQLNVISMEDDEFSSDDEHVEEPGVFSDLNQLKHRPAHLAVFLHYLLSNSDPSPLLFYLVTESYSVGNVKEMKKWAYEIHSTFLCEKAPLRLLVDDMTVAAIDSTLQHQSDKEDSMKSLFQAARNFAHNEISDLLSDFRSKRSLGLGSIYGDHELKDNMDRQSELKIVESALWKHFERLVQDEESDRSQAIAFSLATFFRQVGYNGIKNTTLLERCASFNAKDRKVFRFPKGSKKVHNLKGHQFASQQYFSPTYCYCCQSIIWGIGSQGYQCSNCEQNIHKNCLDRVKDTCVQQPSTARKRDRPRPPSMFEKIISRKPSTNNPAAIKEAQNLHEEQNQLAAAAAAVSHSVTEEGEDSGPDQANVPSRVGKLVARYTELGKSIVSPLDDVTITAPPTTHGDSPEFDVTTPGIEREEHENLSPTSIGRSESLNQRSEVRTSVRRAHSDVRPDEAALAVVTSGSSSNSSLSASCDSAASTSNEGLTDLTSSSHRSSFIVTTPSPASAIPSKSIHLQHILSDPDFDVETELPSLEVVIPKEMLRKLKPKEKKRQDVINELFYTERAHVRNLKVMQRLFFQPMRDDPLMNAELINLLFPNLDDVVEVHGSLNQEFMLKRNENPVVGDFAEILVRKFSSSEGEKFTSVLSKFCQNQSHALEMLKLRQRKDQKFANFLQEAANHPLCRRLELKDLIPMTMQRLTKYPLLIENLLKYTQSTTNEYEQLLRAHECSKNILNEVNRAVQECENLQRLVELQRRLDLRPIENSTHPIVIEFKKMDLTQHRMLYEGQLTWRISRAKQVELHVVLLEDILLLLQRQDEKLVLRCQSTTVVAGKEDIKYTHSPIIKLTNLLTRNVATDKRAFFLVSMSDAGPQIYELVAGSRDEKNKWFKHITDAADAYKVKDAARNRRQPNQPQQPAEMRSVLDSTGTPTAEPLPGPRISNAYDHDISDDVEAHNKSGGSVESLEAVGQGLEVLRIEPSRLVQPNEVVVSSTVCIEKLEPISSPLDALREKNDLIERTMNEKKVLVAEILQIPVNDYETISEMVEEVHDSSDVRELLLGSVTQADKLTRLINDRLTVEGVVQNQRQQTADDVGTTDSRKQSEQDVGGLPIVVSGAQLLSISSRLHQHLSQLMTVMVQRTHEVDQLRAELRHVHSQLDEIHAAASTEELRSRSNSRSQREDSVSRPHSFMSATSSASDSNDGAEQIVDISVEPDHVLATASLVTVPVVMEKLEIIERATQPVVIDPVRVVVVGGGGANSDNDDDDDSGANMAAAADQPPTVAGCS